MQRVYTIEVFPYQNPQDIRRWGVLVGPIELFRDTSKACVRGGSGMTKWTAKREGRRLIRKNERELKRRAVKSEIEEVIVND